MNVRRFSILSAVCRKTNAFFTRTACVIIKIYSRFISPLFAPRCRFYPTCSGYSRKAFSRHGFLKGFALSTWRFLRCHPWSGHHWYDPVPKRFAWRDIFGYKRIGKDNISKS